MAEWIRSGDVLGWAVLALLPLAAISCSTVTDRADPLPEGCNIRVNGFFGQLLEEPRNLSRLLVEIDSGWYHVEEFADVVWVQPERWYRVTDNGVTGWIKDDRFAIEERSEECFDL